MGYAHAQCSKHCRWCGMAYHAFKPFGKDGFCTTAHKQAHYRAYKKYVTSRSADVAGSQAARVTQKKRRK